MQLNHYQIQLCKKSSAEIYDQAPLDVLLDVYPGFHALSPEMAIEDLRGSVRQTALEPVQEARKL